MYIIILYSITCPERLPKGSDKSGLSWGVVFPKETKTLEKWLRGNIIVAFGWEWSLFGGGLSGKFDCTYSQNCPSNHPWREVTPLSIACLLLDPEGSRDKFHCNSSSYSYVYTADIGDYSEDQFPDYTYLSQLKVLPNQTADIQVKIMEHHKEHL